MTPNLRPAEPTPPPTRVQPVLLTAVLVAFTAQQVLQPALPPLAREIGLSELRLGLVISVAAAMLVLAGTVWGRACGRLGYKRVMLTGLGVTTVGLVSFAFVAQAALAGRLGPGWAFGLILATRGLLFGFGIAAVPVAAMAYVATTTRGARERMAGVSRLGAAQGLSVVLGPALGGLLAFAGLLGPIWAAPLVVAATAVLVAALLPGTPTATAASADRVSLRPTDRRVWPYLVAGFTLFLGLGLVLFTVGFLLQDRLGLDAAATARATGGVSFAAGLVLVAVQAALVPRLGWSPPRLLRAGSPVAVLGLVGLAVAPGFWTIVAAMVVVAFGLAVAMPGYVAGPTLVVDDAEQGAVAGLVTATNGLTFVVGPAVGAALYQLGAPIPFLAAACAVAAAAVFVRVHPAFRTAAAPPADAPTMFPGGRT